MQPSTPSSHAPFEDAVTNDPTAATNAAPPVSHSVLLVAERNSKAELVSALAEDDSLLCMNGRVWVPDHADNVEVKLLAWKHAGESGHRGSDGTTEKLREQYV